MQINLLEQNNNKFVLIFSAALDEDIDANNLFYARINIENNI